MRLRWLLLGILSVAAAGCVPARPAGPPVVVEASQVDKLVYWSPELDGRLVSMDGYINFDNGAHGEAIAMGPELRSDASGGGRQLIRFDLERGEGPNQMQLPIVSQQTILPGHPGLPEVITFNMAKATFHDSAGQPHSLQGRVRVTGKLVYARAGSYGLMSEADTASTTGRRLQPGLTDVVLEPAPAS